MRRGLGFSTSGKIFFLARHILLFLIALSQFTIAGAENASAAPAQKVTHVRRDALLDGFRRPPNAARPRVWWHWMNGNITKDGIRKDIQWMKRIGIGGMDCIDASINTPQVVKHRLIYMTPAWQDAFRYATRLANAYGMAMGINSSPGWSETGGPWVSPQAAMKRMVWSRTELAGGRHFHGILPMPPSNIGPFQDAPFQGHATSAVATLKFYRDSIVIAYRDPVERPAVQAATSSSGPLDKAMLDDGDVAHGVTLMPPSKGKDVWIQVSYAEPVTVQGVTLAFRVVPKRLGVARTVEVSNDGKTWRHVIDFPAAAQLQRLIMVQQTIRFAPVTGRYFRIVLSPAPPLPGSLRPFDPEPGLIEPPPPKPEERSYRLYELVFHASATVNEFEKKAQFAAPPRNFYTLDKNTPFVPGTAVDPASVVNLTSRMRPDGTLDWTVPPGHWTVLRIGYSLTGAENHPATPEATGLEVDKLNRTHVRAYMEHYLGMYEKVTGPRLFGRRGLQTVTVDSSEVGMQNWTENILADFKRLRGYDPTPWLPALTGIAVKSPEASNRFLWDFRRTIAHLLARDHYGEIAAVDNEHHLKTYTEALEDHRPTFGDDMSMRQYATYPMGAMWTYGEKWPSALTYEADILGAASVAHIYGQNFAAAESFTSAGRPWAFSPRELKPIVDMEFVRGTNLVVIHTSPHQPVDKPPGLSLFGYGQMFDRLDTWASMARPWIGYMARASYLLQQGTFAADIAYFYGEEAPITSLFGNKRVTDVPEGYAFDFVDKDALVHKLSVENGDLVTKSGMRYRVLYLGGSSSRMTLSTLRRIQELALQGAIVVGKRPIASPSEADNKARFQAAANDLFGPAGTVTERKYGKGEVFPAGSLAQALAALHIKPDFEYLKPEPDAEILFNHRHLKDGELYFISNRKNRPETVRATFRVAGYAPEFWDATNGKVSKADFAAAGDRTKITLSLPPYGSIFVVFRHKTKLAFRAVPRPISQTIKTIKGPWTIAFQKGRGAPPKTTENTLQSWSDSTIPGVKYFSGIGTYTTTFRLTKDAFRGGGRLMLDLGKVRELADVTLNGRKLGIVWTQPFQVDITKFARPGRNVLKVRVANLWINRLIGDAQPGVTKKYTFTIIPTYRADAPLRPSGLLGPVTIRRVH